MKTAISIFLLAILVSVQTPVGQLFKIPTLIEHLLKHQKQDGVSLINFLKDHYTSNHNDGDLPEDEQLPFKGVTFYGIVYAEVPCIVNANVPAGLLSDKKVIFPGTYTPQLHLTSIFHPPRV